MKGDFDSEDGKVGKEGGGGEIRSSIALLIQGLAPMSIPAIKSFVALDAIL